MAANTRMATAVQALCVIACRGDAGTTSEIISRSLKTNPVVVRRLLKSMERVGLVEIRPGKDGGVQLRQPADAITLDQIYRALEAEGSVFALRPSDNPKCPVDRKMKPLLAPIFQAADRAVHATLGQTTLGSLVREIQ